MSTGDGDVSRRPDDAGARTPEVVRLPDEASEGAATRSPARATSVQAVETALALLDCLAAEPELGVAELGRRLGVAKSTAHRIVTTLCANGFVQRVPESRTYRLGIRLHELGELVASRSRLRDHALPLLESLRSQTGETVHLAVPEGSQMFYVERLESYHGLRFSSRVARVRPIHLTSSGKAVAAFNPVVAQAAIDAGFERRTPRTIRTKEQFLRCLAETRERGYAFSIEEDEPGLASVAAPVLDHTRTARAAISVAGPVSRVTGEHIALMARRVQSAADKLMSVESVWWSGSDYR
ncbi:MAG: IclR family transcriptional regulator [Acidimicrobiales bacterium]|jgi:DNA-binding IclR family transcriptional regulator